MINGWYCRGIATDQVDQDYSNMVTKSETSEEDAMPIPDHLMDHRSRYRNLKKKLKFLIYENEFLSDTLRTSQHNFLKVSKDRCALLDRLLKYEKPEMSSSESNEDTDTSDDELPMNKKKKTETSFVPQVTRFNQQVNPLVKRKKPVQRKPAVVPQQPANVQRRMAEEQPAPTKGTTPQNIMTTEEVERHLLSRQSLIELRAPPTVPTEMFSNEPSLDSEGDLLQD